MWVVWYYWMGRDADGVKNWDIVECKFYTFYPITRYYVILFLLVILKYINWLRGFWSIIYRP